MDFTGSVPSTNSYALSLSLSLSISLFVSSLCHLHFLLPQTLLRKKKQYKWELTARPDDTNHKHGRSRHRQRGFLESFPAVVYLTDSNKVRWISQLLNPLWEDHQVHLTSQVSSFGVFFLFSGSVADVRSLVTDSRASWNLWNSVHSGMQSSHSSSIPLYMHL